MPFWRRCHYGSEDRYPELDEIFAFIEISDTSLKKDLRLKGRLYAAGGVSDYLVVELKANVLRHYSAPQGDGYQYLTKLTCGDSFMLARLSGIAFSADAFLNRR